MWFCSEKRQTNICTLPIHVLHVPTTIVNLPYLWLRNIYYLTSWQVYLLCLFFACTTPCLPPPHVNNIFPFLSSSSSQDHIDVGTSTRQSHLHGVAFPIEEDALEAIGDIKTGRLQYVQLVSCKHLSLSLSLSLSLTLTLSLFLTLSLSLSLSQKTLAFSCLIYLH